MIVTDVGTERHRWSVLSGRHRMHARTYSPDRKVWRNASICGAYPAAATTQAWADPVMPTDSLCRSCARLLTRRNTLDNPGLDISIVDDDAVEVSQ